MRACRYHTFADPPAVRIDEIPIPEPGPGEVLVRVRCASLNPVDWKIATGKFRFLVKGGLPRTLGSDFAGEIAATGAGVTDWRAGDGVMGFIDPFQRPAGTFAEFVPVPVEFLARRPASLDEAVAAALPAVGVTAVALCNLAGVGPGSSVLVNGAAGGVGHLALQVAKARGALVAVTASAPRRAWLEGLGADEFIDYAAQPVENWPMAFDAVLDCVPNLPRRRHHRLLRRRGGYASTLPNAWTYTLDPLLNRVGPVVRSAVMLQPDAAAMQELLGYLEDGRLRCAIAGTFPLERVADAIEQSRRGHVAGKLVVRVD
jgi:NADPH:quinone reductase-like Zn-dependent oxidoreductase